MTFFGRNKKGFFDMIYLVMIVVTLAIGIVFGYKLLTAIDDKIQASDMESEAKTASTVVKEKYNGTMGTAFIIVWLASFLGALISAWFIDTHPFLFFISIFILLAICVAVVPIVNTLEAVLSDAELASTTAEFPIIMWFVAHFYQIIIVQCIAILVSLYAKMRSNSYG